MVWIALAILLAGFAAFSLGRRGRRVNDHPVCRKCRFDLVGVYPNAQRCPECGGELAADRDVRVGERQPMIGLRRTGLSLTGIGLVLGGAVLFTNVSGTGWVQHIPTPWLVHRAVNGNPASVGPVINELESRGAAGELQPEHIESLVARILSVQADNRTPWNPAWGDLFDMLQAAGEVSIGNQILFLRQSVEAVGRIRARVRHNATLPLWIDVSIPRTSRSTRVFIEESLLRVEIDDQQVMKTGFGVGRSNLQGPGASAGSGTSVQLNVEPGEYSIRAVWRVRLIDSMNEGAAELVAWEVPTEATIEVVPKDTPIVTVVNDITAAKVFRENCQIQSLQAQTLSDGTVELTGNIRSVLRTTDTSMDVFVLADGNEWNIGSFSFPVGEGAWATSVREKLEGFSATVVRVELRPSVEVAERTQRMVEILGETVSFDGVEVEWQE